MNRRAVPGLEVAEVERLLRQVPLARAPEGLWDDVQATLRQRPRTTPFLRRPVASPLLGAAAVLAALVGGAYAGALWTYRAPTRWVVTARAGTPTVGAEVIAGRGALAVGDWIETDSGSRAVVTLGRIGSVEIGPDSRVRRTRGGGFTGHRMVLVRGSLSAVIAAPPRLFFVETPSVLATDLGCAYTLEVDSTGASRIQVTAGWVELRQGERLSLVPAGLVAEVEVEGGPGTPYPRGFPGTARAALRRLDAGTGGATDLAAVADALPGPSAPLRRRQAGAITLWHLLPRLEGALRVQAFDRLTRLAPLPDRVSREGILALNRPMLDRWRRDLNPMWSEEAQPWYVTMVRRLWEWFV